MTSGPVGEESPTPAVEVELEVSLRPIQKKIDVLTPGKAILNIDYIFF